MTEIVEAHQHFWTYGTYQTSWMENRPMPVIRPLRQSGDPSGQMTCNQAPCFSRRCLQKAPITKDVSRQR
jgi:hypothetical protein